MKSLLERLMRHARWANSRTSASLRALPKPPEEALRLFSHLVTTEQIYLRRMRGEDPFPQDFWPARSLDEAEAVMRSNAEALEAFVAGRGEDELLRTVRYRTSQGVAFETPLDQMLTHLALHGEHHRGQIARMVRTAGGEPAATDLIVFVREEEPGQRRPE